jgi:hypothetical protein
MAIKKRSDGAKGSFHQKNVKYLTRVELLQKTSDAIEYLHSRTCSGRQFKESPTDRARTAYLRVLIAAISAYGILLKDVELEDFERRINVLENRQKDERFS